MPLHIAIVGAGPAGTATAIGLCRLGYRVTLVQRQRRNLTVEGISQHTLNALQQLHCDNAANSVGLQVARSVSWNGETSIKNREFILDRSRFDQALLEDARQQGGEVIAGSLLKVSQLPSARQSWELIVKTDAGNETINADFYIEARGRGAPQRGRRAHQGPACLALSRQWQLAQKHSVSRLATFSQGWGWLISDSNGRAVLQLMTHTERGEEPGAGSALQRYQQLLAQFPEAEKWLQDATPLGNVSACGAGMRMHQDLVEEHSLRVGDAALAPDPLSGHGIFESLSGALSAIPVVHTLLQKPANLSLAKEFYRCRIEQRFLALARVGRDFYQMEQQWPDATFWHQRNNWPDSEDAHPHPLSSPARIATGPVICDGLIETRDLIITADNPLGVWQVNGVPLVALLQRLNAHISLAQAQTEFQSSSENLQQAAAWLRQYQLL